MNDVPSWWFMATGVAGICIALFFLAIVIMLVMVIKLIGNLTPQITGLVNQVNELVPQVKALVEKVDGIAGSTRTTVENVGGHAKGIATSVEAISAVAAASFQRFAPLLGMLMTGAKIYGVIQEVRERKKTTVPTKGKHGEMTIELGKPGKSNAKGASQATVTTKVK